MSVTRFVKRSLIAFLIVHVWLHITWPVSNPKRVNPDDTAYIYVTVSAYSQVSGYKHLSFTIGSCRNFYHFQIICCTSSQHLSLSPLIFSFKLKSDWVRQAPIVRLCNYYVGFNQNQLWTIQGWKIWKKISSTDTIKLYSHIQHSIAWQELLPGCLYGSYLGLRNAVVEFIIQ